MNKISLRISLIIMSVIIILISVFIVSFFSINTVMDFTDKSKGDYAMSLAKIVADMDYIKKALGEENPSESIEPFVEKIRSNTEAEFIVVMNMESIRYSHSNPELIDKTFTGGDEGKAKQGHAYVSKAVGVSGPSLRAFVPIFDGDKQIGIVAVGFFDDSLQKTLSSLINPIRSAMVLSIIAGILGAYVLTGHIKKEIFGLEPSEIAMILKERQTMIESMKDGIISIDKNGNINVINNEAKRILGIPDEISIIGKPIEEHIPNTRLKIVMETRKAEYDKEQIINKCIIITNRVPIIVDNTVVGAMAFFKDKTDVYKIAEELTGVKEYTQALRARSHEFLNKLQTVAGLIELGETRKAIDVISAASTIQQDQMDILVRQLKFPEIVGILLGKISMAKEEGIELSVTEDSHLDKLPFYFNVDNVITILGNLLQNSIECLKYLQIDRKRISLGVYEDGYIKIIVKNNGPRIPENLINKIMERGFTTKANGQGIGLYLVKNIVSSVGGTLNIESDEMETIFSIFIPGEEIYENY